MFKQTFKPLAMLCHLAVLVLTCAVEACTRIAHATNPPGDPSAPPALLCMPMHMHMHAHMQMHMGRTSLPLGTRMSTDLRFCCEGMPAVAGVCHHLCGDGGCGGPLEWDGAGVRLLRRLGVRGTCCLVRGYMVPGARCMVRGAWCTVSHGARCTLHAAPAGRRRQAVAAAPGRSGARRARAARPRAAARAGGS